MKIKEGCSYYIKNEDYDLFRNACLGYSISSSIVEKFKNQKPQFFYRVRKNSISISENTSTWAYPNMVMELFVRVIEYTQEEMEI